MLWLCIAVSTDFESTVNFYYMNHNYSCQQNVAKLTYLFLIKIKYQTHLLMFDILIRVDTSLVVLNKG